MVALIERVGGGKGDSVCNAVCYDAKDEVCRCVCGGLNHGKGLQGALEAMEAEGAALRVLGICGEIVLTEAYQEERFLSGVANKPWRAKA